eukprot:GEMP01005634.1.p1 GENE.GEMP01005634.1~~GEMP01005634.1.p1  ORF type:complete len:479 (+),score=99.69 GEMP01005634.1:156-1592(+)
MYAGGGLVLVSVVGATIVDRLSWVGTPTHDNTLEDWTIWGNCIPGRNAFGLQASVANRASLFFSKYPIESNDIQLEFSFRVTGPPESTRRQGFAFWYVHDDVGKNTGFQSIFMASEILAERGDISHFLDSSGYGLMGYKAAFDGIGVVFNNVESDDPQRRSSYKPTISLLINKGKKHLSLDAGIKIPFDFRNKGMLKARLRLAPNKITLFVQKAETGETSNEQVEFMQVAEVTDVNVRPHGYIGWSALSGPEPLSVAGDADRIQLGSFSVDNLDSAQQGIPEMPALHKFNTTGHHDVLREHSPHKDQRLEGDAIQKLTNTVLKLIFETEPLKQEMKVSIELLSKRVTALEKTLKSLKMTINQKTGHDLDKEFAQVKSELLSLSKVAKEGMDSRRENLENIHSTIAQNLDLESKHRGGAREAVEKQLSTVSLANQSVIAQLDHGHRSTFIMLCVAVAVIAIAGMFLYNKFRSLEKKRIL